MKLTEEIKSSEKPSDNGVLDCKYCGTRMRDLSYHSIAVNYFCPKCNAHYYAKSEYVFSPDPIVKPAKWFSGKEWEAYVELR